MKNVAVIMGGYSSEYKISLTSGGVVCANLNTDKYKAFPVHILKEKWVCVLDGKEYLIDKNDFSVIINNIKITFDVVFNAIHGTPGEDGLMQAYFELLEIPHTSCDYYQAALTFNKRDLLSVLKPYGIKTATSCYLNLGDEINVDEILNKVSLPCFVKPNKSGSSFGISKVKTKEEFLPAIETAYKEDNEIIIVDEFQNLNFHELDSIITRVGENSKIMFCGDATQSDLIKTNEKNGVIDFMKILRTMPSIDIIEFGIDDVIRSGLVKEFLIAQHALGL